jgi:hypothetical protein
MGEGYTNHGYDQAERAYVLSCSQDAGPVALDCVLKAGEQSPVLNPAFLLQGWGDAEAELTLNDKPIPRGKLFRFGHRRVLDSSDLIVWIQAESAVPVRIQLAPRLSGDS